MGHSPHDHRLPGTGILFLGCAITLLGACAIVPKRVYTPQELHTELAKRLPGAQVDLIVPHHVTPQQVALAQRAVMREDTQAQRVAALIRAMFDPRYFGLTYAADHTSSATETLAERRGNCLALASVFVGLARGLGMDAHYLDVSDRVQDVQRNGNFVVRRGHVTAVVLTDNEALALDVGLGLRMYGLYALMNDLEATAHYYNNRGYEFLVQKGQTLRRSKWERAAVYFLSAIRVEPQFARAWNNLGVAYARLGRTGDALLVYEMAIRLDDTLPAPHANAGRLLLAAKRPLEAIAFLRGALVRDPESPGVRYHLALTLARNGSIAQALKVATSLTESESAHDRRLLRALHNKRRLYMHR